MSDTHCEICDVCVRGFDHHCIFFGKCIASNNLTSFKMTLSMPVISLAYTFAVYGYAVLTV